MRFFIIITVAFTTFLSDLSQSHPNHGTFSLNIFQDSNQNESKFDFPNRKYKDAYYGKAKTQVERDAVDAKAHALLASKSGGGIIADLRFALQDIITRLTDIK